MSRSRTAYAAAMVAALGAATPALAGAPGCNCVLFPVVRNLFTTHPAPVAQPPVTVVYQSPRPLYVVNHGPVYDGPGIVIGQMYYSAGSSPRHYPYVGGHAVRGSYGYVAPMYDGDASTIPPGTTIRARAEMRLVTPDQIDIRLYRQD